MKEITYNKLVRDNIIEQINKKKKKANFRILDDNELLNALNQKLLEEANEYIENNKIEELADIFEVILSILDLKSTEFLELEKIREKKKIENGGFDKKIYLVSVTDKGE
jgi:predicted house-cleaning noncanonical NTP pyrophosphatase (MazG superfamily)